MSDVLVFNAKTHALSRYRNVAGAQVVQMLGEVFAVGPDVQVRSPVVFTDGQITSAQYDFKTNELKNVRYAYMGAELEAPAQVEVITEVGPSYTYSTTTNSDSILREHRATFGRGAKARFWQFKIVTIGRVVLREFGLFLHGKERRL